MLSLLSPQTAQTVTLCRMAPHQKKTTYWKTQDVETPGDPGKIRKRLFIDLDRTEKEEPLVKQPKTEDATKKEPMFRRDIGRNMYLVVSEFLGQIKVHLRVYEEEDGNLFPTKKGIALDLEKWKKITCEADEIDSAIDKYDAEMPVSYQKHLGENYYITMDNKYPLVNIRKWWMPPGEDEIVPTKKGASITFEQWKSVKDLMPEVQSKLGDLLEEVEFCECSESHQNQLGFLRCPRCNPNDCMNH